MRKKKLYLHPYILKYDSLENVTLMSAEDMPPCPNPATESSACSGSCNIGYDAADDTDWKGYKVWDCR